MFELRRLTKPVPNPTYNKRLRGGPNARKSFPEGLGFIYRKGADKGQASTIELVHTQSLIVDPAIISLLVKSSKVADAVSFAELSASLTGNCLLDIAAETLTAIMKNPDTRNQIVAAVLALHEQPPSP